MPEQADSSTSRKWSIVRFLFKYRNAGIFTGMD